MSQTKNEEKSILTWFCWKFRFYIQYTIVPLCKQKYTTISIEWSRLKTALF